MCYLVVVLLVTHSIYPTTFLSQPDSLTPPYSNHSTDLSTAWEGRSSKFVKLTW